MDATRRNFIGSAAALPFIAAPALAAQSMAALTLGDRTPWDDALRAYERASAKHHAAAEAWAAAEEAISAELPPSPLRNVTVDWGDGYTQTFDLHPEDLRQENVLPPHQQEQIKAAYKAWSDRWAKLKARHRDDELHAECIRLSKPLHDAHDRLMELPAPDAAALAKKIETAMIHEDIEDHGAVLLADALRLAGKAVQHG